MLEPAKDAIEMTSAPPRLEALPRGAGNVGGLAPIASRPASFGALLDAIQNGILLIDPESHVICDLNPAAEEMLGRARSEVLGRVCHEFVCPREAGRCPITDLGQMVEHAERVLLTAFGERPIIKSVARASLEGRDYLIESISDIGSLKRAEEALREQVHFLQEFIDAIPAPVFFKDDMLRYRGCNAACEELFGTTRAAMMGKTVHEIHPPDLAESYHERDLLLMQGAGPQEYEAEVERPDGTRRAVVFHKAAHRTLSGRIGGVVGVILDITERKRVEQQRKRLIDELQTDAQRLRSLSAKDPLTKVANRGHFDQRLGWEWVRAQRDSSNLAVLMIDIDHFKAFNDVYGHQVGDDCLIMVADVLARTARRATDLVARYGGEEFVVLLPETPPRAAESLAEKMRETVRRLRIPHRGSATDVIVTVSIGAAAATPGRYSEAQRLVEAADAALYAAKRAGRDKVACAD